MENIETQPNQQDMTLHERKVYMLAFIEGLSPYELDRIADSAQACDDDCYYMSCSECKAHAAKTRRDLLVAEDRKIEKDCQNIASGVMVQSLANMPTIDECAVSYDPYNPFDVDYFDKSLGGIRESVERKYGDETKMKYYSYATTILSFAQRDLRKISQDAIKAHYTPNREDTIKGNEAAIMLYKTYTNPSAHEKIMNIARSNNELLNAIIAAGTRVKDDEFVFDENQVSMGGGAGCPFAKEGDERKNHWFGRVCEVFMVGHLMQTVSQPAREAIQDYARERQMIRECIGRRATETVVE